MLVCNVSLQIPRTISADIAEVGAAAAVAAGHIVSTFVDIIEAADATATAATEGNVFPALVDDPASASDHLDARLGQYMVEAANASDAVSAGSGAISTRSAMVIGWCPVFINSDGTPRSANADGTMINL